MTDIGRMGDEFHFGEPAKRPARLGEAKPKDAALSLDPRLIWITAGLVVAGVLAFVFLRGADDAVDATRFGAAVRSWSGTCWWARIDASGVTTYGSGSPCTGTAAMAASAASW